MAAWDVPADAVPAAAPAATPALSAPGWQMPSDAAPGRGHEVTTDESALARAKSLGTKIVGDAIALPHNVADLVDWGADKLARGAGWATGRNFSAPPAAGPMLDSAGTRSDGMPYFPTSEQARDYVFSRFGTQEYVPQTLPGKLLDAGVEAAATGGRKVLVNGLGGAGGELADYVLGDRLGHVVPRLLGFATGSKLGAGTANLAGEGLAAATGKSPSAYYQSWQRLGLPDNLAGTATQNPYLMAKEARTLQSSAGQSVRDAATGAIDSWRDALTRTADKLGTAETLTDVGNTLKTAAADWLQGFRRESANRWNDVRAQVPGSTTMQLPSFESAWRRVSNDYSGAPNTRSVLGDPVVRRLGNIAVDARNGNITWNTAHNALSDLGGLIADADPIASRHIGALRSLYNGLSDDLKATAAASGGPGALNAFTIANDFTRGGHAFLENTLNRILGRGTTPEVAAKFVTNTTRAGATQLDALTSQLPQRVTGDIGSYLLRNAGGNPAATTPNQWAGAMVGRRPVLAPEVQQSLWGNRPDITQNVADLAATGRGMGTTAALLNHSNTANYFSQSWWGRLIASNEVARAAEHMGAGPEMVTAIRLGGLFMPEYVGKANSAVLTSPATTRLFSREPPWWLTGTRTLSPAGIAARATGIGNANANQ